MPETDPDDRAETAPRSRTRQVRKGAAAMASASVRRAEEAAETLRGRAAEGYDRAQDWASDGYETLSRGAVYARRRGFAELNRGQRSVAAFVDENPIMVGVAGLAAGLLIGALLPSTRRENKLLGPYADDLRREGARYAREAAHQGREAISENIRAMAQPRDAGRD